MITQGSSLTLEWSTYPRSRLFKPETTRPWVENERGTGRIERRFIELLNPVIPLTAQDEARKWKPKAGSALTDFDDKELDQWEHRGIHWVRKSEGPHANCWTSHRKGAHALWRNAHGSYSGWGFPTFLPETMKRFHREFEVIKPVLLCKDFPGGDLLISLWRTLEGPVGTCWGIRTGKTFWRLTRGSELVVIDTTKAALHRALTTLKGQ